MKSSSSTMIVCLLVGLFVVPFNCQDTANVGDKAPAAPTEKPLSNNNPVVSKASQNNNNTAVLSDSTTNTTATGKPITEIPEISSTLAPTVHPNSNDTTTTKVPETTTTTSETKTPNITTKTPETTSKTPETTTKTPETTTKTPDTTTKTPNTTTKTPDTTSTPTPATSTASPNTTTTTTPAPSPTPLPPCRRFDGPSFIGGIVLTLGLLAIGLVTYVFYKARNERNYHTL